MKTKWKFGVWGQFGDGSQIADGQAVRTTIITEEIMERYGTSNVGVVNTNGWKRNPVLFLLRSVKLVANSANIIIFPADNGFKVFVPLLNIINSLFRRNLYYVVIGGFLPELLTSNKRYLRILRKYKALFVQTPNLKKDLEQLGLDNLHILSNLKKLKAIDEDKLVLNEERVVNVCTFSRVTYNKGIEDAINGVIMANHRLGSSLIFLDIYGIIDDSYSKRFNELLQKHSDFVKYKGVVDYDKTVHILRNYTALIFPTFYHGEGFAGDVFQPRLGALLQNIMANRVH